MKKAIILHGTMGNPDINWFRWLESELKAKGFVVEVPQLPTPEGQNLENWLKVVDYYKNDFAEGAILIGHSLGATCALKYLEQTDTRIKEVYLVAPVIDFIELENKEIQDLFNGLNSTFVEDELNWDKIAKNLRNLYTFHGDNDPYVPLWHAECIQDNLGGILEVIANGGHLNSEFGYDKFEKLLERILEKRRSSRVIVSSKADKQTVYLMFRRKNGEEYLVVPGGGVELWESFEEAAEREIMEELGISISNLKELETIELESDICKIFTADEVSKSAPTGEELKNVDPNNYYEIQEHKLENIKNLNLKPDFYQDIIKKIDIK